MRLDILKALNTERAARRAAVVVTNQESGTQRLVTQDVVAADPLKDVLETHLRSGKSGIEETNEGKVFLTVHVPPTRLLITGAVHISQALAPIASKKTHARRLERLNSQGISDAQLARIHAPIGLPIGAISPPEIAVAIMGEITSRLRLTAEGKR